MKEQPLASAVPLTLFVLKLTVRPARQVRTEGKGTMMRYGFSADMIIKHEDRQIKGALMKDRHQSATSLGTPRGMTRVSRRRNTVTHPPLSSLSWSIDWAFISVRLALTAAVMNGQTADIIRIVEGNGNHNKNRFINKDTNG